MEAIGWLGCWGGGGCFETEAFWVWRRDDGLAWLCSALHVCGTFFSALLLLLLFLRTGSTARIAAPSVFMACRRRGRGGRDCVREVYLGRWGIGSMMGSGRMFFLIFELFVKTGSLRTVPLTPQSQE